MHADRDLARLRATYDDLLEPGADDALVRVVGALEAAHAAPVPPLPRLPRADAPRRVRQIGPLALAGRPRWAKPSTHHARPGVSARIALGGLVAALLVAVVAGGLLLARARLTPAAPTQTRLLYPGSVEGRAGIVAADGAVERVVAPGDYAGVTPAPDGRRFLAYGAAGTAGFADLHAGDGRLLRHFDLGDATPLIAYWAPDARRVALFARSGDPADWAGSRFRTWLLDDDGGRELALGAQVHVGTASGIGAWSPDGRLFLTVLPGDAAGRRIPGTDYELWTVEATTGVARALPGGPAVGMGWAADGTTIYAIAGGGVGDATGSSVPTPASLLAVDSRTGARRTLATADDLARQLRLAPPGDGPLPELPGHWTFAATALAPGGEQLATWLIPTNAAERAAVGYRPHLAVVDGAGRVVGSGYGAPLATPRFAAWSPDGRRLLTAFTANTGGVTATLGLLTPTGPREQPHEALEIARGLGGDSADETSVRWSPDGQSVAFLRAGRIVVVTGSDLAETRELAGASRGWPAWQVDATP